ncbi:MAG: hypothetical protein QOC66_2897, partial [Pseudonocardiales bacterium]|nr:hypothetical protein [Pseudonocardiales bacterium]
MRRVLALTATVAVLTATGLVFATGADAGVSPGTGTTVRGTTTFTESPGGSDNSSILGIKHCGGNTSTQLQLINSANQVVWSTSNGGGTLTASVRTEDYANGTYTLRGTENSGANNGFGGFGCKTNTATFNNTVIISNQKVLAYTGNTAAVAGTTTTVSAKVTDPNDGSSPISGQVVSFALSGGPTATATTNAAGIASTTLTVNIPPRAATLAVSSAATTFYTASDASVPFSIDKIPSGVNVTPTSPVVHGQAVSFSATVTHNPGLPATGQVQFVVDGGNFGGPVTLTGDVAQSSATSSLSTADHTVVAQYLGDTNYLASTSATATQRVDKAATGTTIASSLNPAVYGQPITFTAQVAVVAPGVGAPGGSVQFDVDGNPFGTAVPMTGASAALTIPSLGGGNHAVTATYNGNTDFASSTSAELTQGVDLAGTKVVLHSSSEPSVTGQPVSFSVDVSALPPGVGTPTGEVQFSVDGTDLGAPVTLTNGSATSASVANLAPGTHVVLADYHGSANFSGALGAFNQHVQAAATRTTVDSTPNPSVFGQQVTFAASVAVLAPGAGTPTGLVQFYVDGVASGVPVALQDGAATGVAVTELATGGHQVTAVYLGDPNFAGSESGPVTQTVNRARTTTTLTSSANPSVWGQPVQLTATVGVVAPG